MQEETKGYGSSIIQKLEQYSGSSSYVCLWHPATCFSDTALGWVILDGFFSFMNLLIRNFGEVVNKKMRFSFGLGSPLMLCVGHSFGGLLCRSLSSFAVTVEGWFLLLAP